MSGSYSGGWLVRILRPDDVVRLLGDVMDPAYNIHTPVGYAAEHNGELAAAGMVTWDTFGRCWGWLNCRERVPPRIMHMCALKILGLLRDEREPDIRMIIDLSKEGAEHWARRLGFVPEPALQHPLGPIFRCDLST